MRGDSLLNNSVTMTMIGLRSKAGLPHTVDVVSYALEMHNVFKFRS